jgi:ComF family protein
MYPILSRIRSRMASRCPLCLFKTQGVTLCPGCLTDIKSYDRPSKRCLQCGDRIVATASRQRCRACLAHPPAFAQTVFAFAYDYPMDFLIQAFKEQGRLGYAALFADLLWSAMQVQVSPVVPLTHLVPVPSGASSLLRRGFNPAGEVARALRDVSGLTLSRDWLVRIRDTAPQKALSLAARRQSVGELYRCDTRLPAVWIGLVDDVMTTGSTLQACAQALLGAGAAGVVALVVARTPQVWQNASYVSCHPRSA